MNTHNKNVFREAILSLKISYLCLTESKLHLTVDKNRYLSKTSVDFSTKPYGVGTHWKRLKETLQEQIQDFWKGSSYV